QFVLAHIGSDVLFDLSGRQQFAQAPLVDAGIIGDGGKVLDALAHQGIDQVLRNTAKSETSYHQRGAILHVAYGLIRTGNDFIHKQKILNRYEEGEQIVKIAAIALHRRHRASSERVRGPSGFDEEPVASGNRRRYSLQRQSISRVGFSWRRQEDYLFGLSGCHSSILLPSGSYIQAKRP